MKSRDRAKWAAVLWLLLALPGYSQAPPEQPSSRPSGLVYLDNKIIFHAADAQYGRTIRAFDIATETTEVLMNIEAGSTSANFENSMRAAAGYVFFAVRRPQGALTLFRSDGTPEGTIVLRNFELGHTNPFRWTFETEHYVFFDIFGLSSEERGLWRSDGTVFGTTCLNCGSGVGMFETATRHDSGDIFAASLTAGAVVRSDGSVAGTRNLIPAVGGVGEIHALGDKLLVASTYGVLGAELGVYDGDTGELLEVVDVCPGPCGGIVQPNFFPFKGEVLFAANDGRHGRELWITGGAAENTRLLKDINPGASGSEPFRFTEVGDFVYFTAIESNTGRELWRTDGTSEGTRLVKDIYPGPQSSEPYAFVARGNALIFTANDGEHGDELWLSLGSNVSTHLLADINPGVASSSPYDTIDTPHHVYFSAEEPNAGRELWRSTSGKNTAMLVADVWSLPVVNPGSNPIYLTPAGDKLFFVLNDLEHGAELWVTEGDPEDARLVKDIFPGPSSSSPHHLTYFSGRLYFAADNGIDGVELWRSDGTTEGTGLHLNIAGGAASSAPRYFTESADGARLYFVAHDQTANIYWLNADTGGVNRGVYHGPLPSEWQPRNLVYWDKRLFFTADDGVHGEELWVVQDTVLQLYRDFVSAPVGGVGPDRLTPLGETLYFTVEDAVGTRQLGAIHGETEALEEAIESVEDWEME